MAMYTTAMINLESIIKAGTGKAWAVLGPGFADIQKWASSVTQSSANDNQSFNGSPCTVRSCTATGIGKVKEQLILFSPSEHTITYQVAEGLPKPIKYVVSTWKLFDSGNGKTKLEITVELKTGGIIGTIFKGALKRKMTKLYSETADEFKYYVENELPHPRKFKAATKT
jgi:hypothetical protein